MTSVERLQAAIDKLERLHAATGYYEAHGWLVENITVGPEHDPREEHQPLVNDELIVTLHRTIDVQLAILTAGLTDDNTIWTVSGEPVLMSDITDAALELADAILGSES